MIKQYSYASDGQTFLNPHFQVGEFRSYDDSLGYLTTDVILIDDKLPSILENIFNALNCSSIYITSGYRSEDFDIRIGGFAGYHSKGQAVDIMCYGQDGNLISSVDVCITAENLGVLGIGYGGNYTHIDTRDWKSFFDETNGAVNINSWYDYFGIPRPTTGIITYQAFTDKWYPEVRSCEDYAGVFGETITGFRCKPQFGEIIYEAHLLGGDWIGAVSSNEYANGTPNDYAGIYKRPIDGIRIKSSQGWVKYRVHIKGGDWLDWAEGFGDSGNEYAGIYGQEIDGIQCY